MLKGLVSHPFDEWDRIGGYSEEFSEYFAYLLDPFFHFGPGLPNCASIL